MLVGVVAVVPVAVGTGGHAFFLVQIDNGNGVDVPAGGAVGRGDVAGLAVQVAGHARIVRGQFVLPVGALCHAAGQAEGEVVRGGVGGIGAGVAVV